MRNKSRLSSSAVRMLGGESILLQCDRVTISRVTLQSRQEISWHLHDSAQICVVLKGEYQERICGKIACLRSGSVLFHPAAQRHANIVGTSDVQVLLIDINPSRVKNFWPSAPNQPIYFERRVFDDICAELLWELNHPDDVMPVAVEGLICSLEARITRCRTSSYAAPVWLSGATGIIRSRYQKSVGLSGIAAALDLHPVTLAVAFRRYLGTSVGQYLMDLRIAHAKRELTDSRKTIAEIAQEAGFYDESHLGRVFRRRFGTPPGTFRAHAQGYSRPKYH